MANLSIVAHNWGVTETHNRNTLKIIKKGATIVFTGLLVLIIILCLALLLGFSNRDRSVLTQRYKSVSIGGFDRQYLISEASATDPATKVVIGLHGLGDSARKFAYYTAMHNVVSSKDIVIYPQAVKPEPGQRNGWNAEFCCGSGWKQGIDDAKYIVELAETVKKQYGVPNADIFVAGFSNGAFMAQKVAVDYPEKVSAVGSMAGSIGTTKQSLKPKAATPIILIHGDQDQTVPINGGARPSDPDFDWLPLSKTKSVWETANGGKAPVKSIIYNNDAHIWHDWRLFNFWHKKPAGSQEMINFFSQFTR